MAAMSLFTVACVEETPYEKGAPDADGCYGVYFPAQASLEPQVIEPGQKTLDTIYVARTVTTGAIDVPVTVKGDSLELFTVGNTVSFADGQTESFLIIDYSKINLGVQYKLHLSIEDPQYASKYGEQSTFADFSVLIEKFELIGTGLFRDDLISALYGIPDFPEYEVEIYHKPTSPGSIYLKNAYTSLYPYNAPGEYVEEDKYFEINISNPDAVYVPYQGLGMDWGEGDFLVASFIDKYFNTSSSVYGTLKDKIITFPAQAILVSMEGLGGSFYYGNGSGMFRVCLPGAILADYSVGVKAGLTTEGAVPVKFTLGTDIKKVKYSVYEGELNVAQVDAKVAAILDGSEKNVAEITESKEVALTMTATGVYTIVSVGFDAEGKPQYSGSTNFTFVADSDPVPVVVNAGLGSAAKYAPAKVDTDTALEMWIYGEDLTEVKAAVFSYPSLVADEEGCIKKLMETKSLADSTLALVNSTGYVTVVSKLVPGTEHYLAVWATNGYEEKVIFSNGYYTTGDPLPVYANYSLEDLDEKLAPKSSEGYFGTYNYYALDLVKGSPLRNYLGQVTIADSKRPDSDADEYGIVSEYVDVTGVIPGAKEMGLKETLVFEYYDGYLYTMGDVLGQHKESGLYTYLYHMDGDTGGLYDATIVGGFVDNGYLAFVNYYADQGLNINTLFVAGFGDEAMTDYKGGLVGYGDLLFVDPKVDDNGLAPAPDAPKETSKVELNTISRQINQWPANYVETERGRIRSIIDSVKGVKSHTDFGKIMGERSDIKSVSFKAETISTSTDPKTPSVYRREYR